MIRRWLLRALGCPVAAHVRWVEWDDSRWDEHTDQLLTVHHAHWQPIHTDHPDAIPAYIAPADAAWAKARWHHQNPTTQEAPRG